jgi:hypothetical protein
MVATAIVTFVTLGRRKLQEGEGHWLKLINGTVMLGMGAVLMLKPEWLTEQRQILAARDSHKSCGS